MDAITPDVLGLLGTIFELFFTLGASGFIQTLLALLLQLLGLGA